MEWDNNNSDLSSDEKEGSFDLNDGVGPIPFPIESLLQLRLDGSWSRMLSSLTTLSSLQNCTSDLIDGTCWAKY
ncbi:unnamed protein product [Linum trigynum]|uniref:Uncharacterized protein n=1 Tax=Linum trigynum TaxID=586398 RepID=A0AAV2CRS8_9ROSI